MIKQERTSFNSDALREAYPTQYHPLYSSSEIVVSAAGSFYWAGEHLVLYGGPAIIQKLPVRAYVGLQRTTQPGLHLEPLRIYSSGQEVFDEEVFPDAQRRGIALILKPLLHGLVGTDGLKVSVLLEMSPAVGLNSSGAMAAAFACAIYILGGKLAVDEAAEWQSQATGVLLQNKNFNRVFRLAWKLDAAISGGYSSGAAVLASMIGARYPVIYWSAGRAEKDSYPGEFEYPAYVGGDPDALDKIPVFAARLEEIYNLQGDKDLPLDYGLLFTGRARYSFAATNDIAIKRSEEFQHLANSLGRLAAIHASKAAFVSPLAMDQLDPRTAWWRSVLIQGTGLVAGIGDALSTSLTSANAHDLARLVDLVNHYNKFLYLLGAGNPHLEAEAAEVRWYIENHWHATTAGVKTTGAGQGGDLLFVFPHEIEFMASQELADHMERKFQLPNMKIHYTSWEDGSGYQEGILVHYLPELDIVPGSLRGLCRVYRFGKGHGESLIPDNSVDDEAKKFDLAIVGMPHKEGVWVNGEEASFKMGKPLATKILCDVMRGGRTVQGDDLGSYSEKSAFLSSLIHPLDELITHNTGRPLPVEVTDIPLTEGGGFVCKFRDDPKLAVGLILPIDVA